MRSGSRDWLSASQFRLQFPARCTCVRLTRVYPPAEMEIRTGTLVDLPALARLHAGCFAVAWDVEFLGRLLGQPGTFFLLARDENADIGFVLARTAADEAEILSLGVMPIWRTKGIGAALSWAAVQRAEHAGARAIFLEVSIENEAARAVYKRLGFVEVGRRPNYYPELPAGSGNALILRRPLPL